METQKLIENPEEIPGSPPKVVPLPGMTMPLHIFELRYKKMVQECLDRNAPFGMVSFDGNKIHMEKGMHVLQKFIERVRINQEVLKIIGTKGHVRAFLFERGMAP